MPFKTLAEDEERTLAPCSPQRQLDEIIRRSERVTANRSNMVPRPPVVIPDHRIHSDCGFSTSASAIRGRSDCITMVYVYDAGASYHAGYPLASALGGPLSKEMFRSPDGRHVTAAECLSDQFGEPSDFEDWVKATTWKAILPHGQTEPKVRRKFMASASLRRRKT